MSSSNPSLLQSLGTQMRYLTQRQAVLSQNIANIDTPGYKGQDLKKLDFADLAKNSASKLAMTTTSPKHLSGLNSGTGEFTTAANEDTFETNPNKNNVVLDEEMAKISDTGAQYQMSSSLFRKFTAMYRTALGNH